MKGTNKVVAVVVVVVVVVVASNHYYSTERHLHTWIIFYYSRQYFEKVVKWESGSFEFYLLLRVILHESHSIRGVLLDVTE